MLATTLVLLYSVSEGALFPITHVIKGDIKQYRPQNQTLRCTARDWSPARVHVTDNDPSNQAVQAIFGQSHCQHTKPVLHLFVSKDVMTVLKALL